MSDRNMHSSRRKFVTAAGATGALALAGCTDFIDDGSDSSGNGGGGDGGGSTNGGGVDTVYIGSNHPLTGPVSRDGNNANEAVKLAIERKNQQGGIESLDGAELEIIEGDNQGAQELGAEITRELVQDGADIVLGAVTSPATMAATQQAEREQTPFVVTVGSDRDILTDRGLNWAYRPQPHQYQQAVNYAETHPQAIRDAGGTAETAGLIYVDNTFGQETVQGLNDHLSDNGVEIIEEQSYPFGPSSVDTQVTAMAQADPDIVSITSYAPGGQLIAQAMEQQGYRPDHIACCTSTTFADPSVISDVGEFANGISNTITTPDQRLDRYSEISEAYQEATGNPIALVAGISYAATEVAIAAIEQAGSAAPDDINDALSNIRVEDHLLAMPPIEFNDEGENENAFAPVNQVQNMDTEVVAPEEYTTAEFQV